MNQVSAPAPTRGLIVIVAAVVVGGLLLLVAFDDAGSGGGVDVSTDTDEATTDTTAPPVTASTVPAGGEDPAQVPVYVANGSGGQGRAAAVTEQLRGAGYAAALEPGNSPETQISQVYFLPEYEAEAAAVGAALSLGADRVVAMPNPCLLYTSDAADE